MKSSIDRTLNSYRTTPYSCPIPAGLAPGQDLKVNLTDGDTNKPVGTFVFAASQVSAMTRVKFLPTKESGRWKIKWIGEKPVCS